VAVVLGLSPRVEHHTAMVAAAGIERLKTEAHVVLQLAH
jgi:hypothetical protein